MLSIVVAGRNDDYGKGFRERLFRSALHNAELLGRAAIDFEYILAEWNPLPDRPLLSEEFVSRVPNARSVVIPPEVHSRYTLNPRMPFHEMPAKNAALRRASGETVIVTNADILFGEDLVARIAAGGFDPRTLYRAHRIDVKPNLSWSEIRNPLNQLPSGEGVSHPVWYMGAGGDFCLAARELWHALSGFDERIRFSTRAKDWQFFLSAAAQGARIEFLGDVYHLDHEGGFRNTSAQDLKEDAVHFGKWWDIEFGIPVMNGEDWGFDGLRELAQEGIPRVSILKGNDGRKEQDQDQCDRRIMSWITRPNNQPENDAAFLFHAVCTAHRRGRRLICRIAEPSLAVTLSGFDAVASRFAVPVFCNWEWPQAPGYNIRPFVPEPRVLQHDDWILEQDRDGLRVREAGTRTDVAVLPSAAPVNSPEFNPMLARRLLRVCLHLQKGGLRRIAICGRGSHTDSLLQWGLPDSIELVAVIDSRSLAAVQPDVDAFLLSSASFEQDMMEACRRHGIGNVVSLYGGWPVDAWMTPGIAPGARETACLA